MVRSFIGTIFAAVLVATAISATPVNRESPMLSDASAKPIDGHYLVVLHDDLQDSHIVDHYNWISSLLAGVSLTSTGHNPNRIKHVYDIPGAVRGYAGRFDESTIDSIRKSKHVAYVEQDQMVSIYDQVPPDSSTVIQRDAPWGLSRISHRERPNPSHYKEYPFSSTAGANVSVYVIDTGINIKHVDFEGRARWGATIPENDEDVDGNGHGTHCAGTISGKKYGVAKMASAVAVKVLSSNGSGSMSDVIKGVEWAVNDHKRRRQADPKAKSVANMSLGGGSSRTLNRAVDAAVESGIHFAVAAGNDNRDACNYSPAASEKAITVGATSVDDRMAWFSNVGSCVDIFAPGKDILSTWIGSNSATNTISGTSMASPHVAGVLAYLVSQADEEVSPKDMKKLMIKSSTKNTIKGLPEPGKGKQPGKPKWPFPWPPGDGDNEELGKTPNRLLFTGYSTDIPDPEPPNVPEPLPQPPFDDDEDEKLFRILPMTHDLADDDESMISLAILNWLSRAVHHIRVRANHLIL